MIHRFDNSLATSKAYAHAPWWEEVYRKTFYPRFKCMRYVANDGPWQRDGIDRIIETTAARGSLSHYHLIDEKVRGEDWNDFFLEFWSDKRHRTRGWVAKDIACDYIAYAFIPSRRCYLLPFPALREAWRRNHSAWSVKYKRILVHNEDNGRHWTTEGTPVPIHVVFAAINEAMLVHWSEPSEKLTTLDLNLPPDAVSP